MSLPQKFMQSAKELLDEFAAIAEFIASGEKPSAQDRKNAVALWAKMLQKLDSGPIPARSAFSSKRRELSARQSFEDKEGKPMTVARFEQNLDAILEADDPGCNKMYVSAGIIIDQFEQRIKFLEKWLEETAPAGLKGTICSMPVAAISSIMDKPEQKEETTADAAPKKPRAKRIKVPEPAAETQDAAAGKDEGSDEGDKDTSEAAPADASAPAEEVSEESQAPKSSFQKILEKAGK